MPRAFRTAVFALTLLAFVAGSGQALPSSGRPAPAATHPAVFLGDAWEWIDAHLLAPGREWWAVHGPGSSARRKDGSSMDPDGINALPPAPKTPTGVK